MDTSHVRFLVYDHVKIRNGQDEITTFKNIFISNTCKMIFMMVFFYFRVCYGRDYGYVKNCV